jgi:hypothetical protein
VLTSPGTGKLQHFNKHQGVPSSPSSLRNARGDNPFSPDLHGSQLDLSANRSSRILPNFCGRRVPAAAQPWEQRQWHQELLVTKCEQSGIYRSTCCKEEIALSKPRRFRRVRSAGTPRRGLSFGPLSSTHESLDRLRDVVEQQALKPMQRWGQATAPFLRRTYTRRPATWTWFLNPMDDFSQRFRADRKTKSQSQSLSKDGQIRRTKA